jgi:MoaA/NifB/PqqE/SkfB family radical SAM enzyme
MRPLEETLTNLDIYLGDACNLRCVQCQCWINESAPHFEPSMLEARLFEAVEYAASECPSFEKVMMIGGEPFIHEGMVRFLTKQRINTCITVYTNFVWPDPDVVLPDNVYFLSSLDAASQEVYGQLRRTRDFSYSQEGMRRRSGQLWHVDTTVSKGNIHTLDAILDITENYGCTHWFLPIDPRVLRYNDRITRLPMLGTPTERATAERTARRAREILLDDDDIREMENFYRRRGSERTNDFETFLGIYLSGVDRFKGEDFEYRRDLQVQRPASGEQLCPGIRRYMEITFTPDGKFVPVIHCPDLTQIVGAQQGPALGSFAELMAWENSNRRLAGCHTFCGHTQFLGIDEYEKTFRDVAKVASEGA